MLALNYLCIFMATLSGHDWICSRYTSVRMCVCLICVKCSTQCWLSSRIRLVLPYHTPSSFTTLLEETYGGNINGRGQGYGPVENYTGYLLCKVGF